MALTSPCDRVLDEGMDLIFEWDEGKRQLNLEKHGLDFVLASQLFDGRPILSVPALNAAEDRFLSVGELEGRIVAVVWIRRGEVIRLISARSARLSERRAYDVAFSGTS